MRTRYGLYCPCPGSPWPTYTLYRITTQAGLDEFGKIVSSAKGDAIACFIPEVVFHRVVDENALDGTDVEICFASDDPDDREKSNYIEDLLEIELDRGVDVGDPSDWYFYMEGSEVFLEISRWWT
ncbi:hypothetical protein JI721_12035 [Alicyclobacillus cycloheptanicus]|uniref:Uncharacterized protein n=1 Tax=Alicyclobacillus cycloheptanicus TaxID=1457 RepID=A0ABT9XLW0_9BACL|nr:hypothetical protein [Alicyclobacillus cycloheptanicus]MDQ0191278.1 hypothetical protein [Alicyclobacillus cycloheptanicus]WDM00448.1 hypothetical protein JI721_12035 [Alicyclobacillus cycloheptanicus]